mmetsp:Transcript_20182/g.63103  ORF Transcript_20182/g.63103 Transcript_20182/m.63103 type:complete len:263 (+) Transcript_20182:371-1159(+)
MVRPRRADVLQAVLAHQLLPCLNTHPDMWHQDLVLRHLHLGLPHDEPFAGVPLIAPVPVGIVVAALHAHDRLLVLAHGELLQVIVRLEEDLANGRARQPCGLEALQEHRGLRIEGAAFGVHRVQGEERLPALAPADLNRQREVLQIDGRGRVERRGNAHAFPLLQHQAAHALRRQAALQPACSCCVPRNPRRPPADVVLDTIHVLPLGLGLLASLLLLARLAQQLLRHALAVEPGLRLALARVPPVARGQPAEGAEVLLLPV